MQHNRTPAPWAPPRGEVEMVKVGPHWDVLRAPAEIGERALELLGDASGAVIADYGLMYWLIPSGHAEWWGRMPNIHALGAHAAEVTYVGVPPEGWTEGPRLHWRVPGGRDRYLTDPHLLRLALARAIAEPVEEATAR
ncbi:hypothetical protein ACFZCY_04925 [Streptomyces sp. NPDC007983]|uniref:hypothetical protein n=1 Tax=Streptomyces sp. NPDC007983 TaxID=3364800 RepID=UPI0036E53F12